MKPDDWVVLETFSREVAAEIAAAQLEAADIEARVTRYDRWGASPLLGNCTGGRVYVKRFAEERARAVLRESAPSDEELAKLAQAAAGID